MIRDTGSPRIDAENDFLRARRHQAMSAVAARFRSDGVDHITPLSLDDAIAALGRRSERSLGTLVIPLNRIVGSVDKVRDFDRWFRPTSNRARPRWEKMAEAFRRGEPMPPIDVFKVGDLYFVADGHHRVSVSRALGLDLIEANVREIITTVSPDGVGTAGDLDRKHWRRLFVERCPLPDEILSELFVARPEAYGVLAERIEAWGARRMYCDEEYHDPATTAMLWYADEYKPVLAMIDDAGLRWDSETAVDSYLRIACERYELTRDHTWDSEVLERLRSGKSAPAR